MGKLNIKPNKKYQTGRQSEKGERNEKSQ